MESIEKNNMLKEFCIPTYIFIPESPVEHASQIPSCPVIVFINTKSGGQLGHRLIVTYRKLLNHAQVDPIYLCKYACKFIGSLAYLYCKLGMKSGPGLICKFQVFDLREEGPDMVLHKLYSNLERLKRDGDTFASEIYKRLRLIVSATRQFHSLANAPTTVFILLLI
jgi:diacylglycerol kinase (ATP)